MIADRGVNDRSASRDTRRSPSILDRDRRLGEPRPDRGGELGAGHGVCELAAVPSGKRYG